MTPHPHAFDVGPVRVGEDSLALIAGPCVIESADLCLEIASAVRDISARHGIGCIFKASFDKANRTSIESFRGPGIDAGLRILAQVRQATGLPVLTDIHEPSQAQQAAEHVDMLQIPAFLARQTDLLAAAAATEKPVNIKKAQFMAPLDMRSVLEKLTQSGCRDILVTERGSCFGYNNLVVDFRSLPLLRSLGHPVCYDVTHSMQQPGGLGSSSGATREFAPHLLRAAVAVGVDALFIEVHPDPPRALSDAAAQLPLDDLDRLLGQVVAIRRALRED